MNNIEINYKITTDHTLLDKQNAITPELKPKLERFHQLALEGKKSSVKKILDAIEQYPDNPQLKNYLSGLYGELNEIEKMHDTNKWIIAEHPNYLFGKLNLANEYYLNEEYDKIPDVLGHEMELKALYPDRDTFHLNEVLSFYKSTVLYFLAIGDFEEAEMRYDIMLELSPDSDVTEFATQQILLARLKLSSQRFEEEQKSKIAVETSSQEITTKSKAPHFNHKEIEWLYSNGLYMGEDKLNKILSLPKDTLVQDLELVLQDSIDRYTYFDELVYENGWDEETINFVVHAIFLLGELQAEDSLDAIFNMLSQSDDYIELYFWDFISILWEPFYKIAFNRLKDCKQFMFKPGINTYSRSNFIDVVEQLALHHPERRSEALAWYSDVIQFYLNSSLDDNVIDSDLIGLLVWSLIDIKGSELLPDIEKLFEGGLVSEGICGDFEKVKEAFKRPENHNKKREILPIAERYKEITSTWAGYNEEYSSSDFDDFDDDESYYKSSETYQRTEPKIGRNEPCPCGSGKKYKKCCLNK